MLSWTAVVSLKAAADRKTRLAATLSPEERVVLSETMAQHVIATLRMAPGMGRVLLLSPTPPEPLQAEWVPDEGKGLNRELKRVRASLGTPMLVIHADLPLLIPQDVAALLSAAEESGAAIAPDRHGDGTNAIALSDTRPFHFAYGPGSFDKHAKSSSYAIVRRQGLSFDVDSPEDLEYFQRGRMHIPSR